MAFLDLGRGRDDGQGFCSGRCRRRGLDRLGHRLGLGHHSGLLGLLGLLGRWCLLVLLLRPLLLLLLLLRCWGIGLLRLLLLLGRGGRCGLGRGCAIERLVCLRHRLARCGKAEGPLSHHRSRARALRR